MNDLSGSALFSFLQSESARRKAVVDRLTPLMLTIPVDDATRSELSTLNPKDQDAVLQNHPGYKVDRKVGSLDRMLRLFSRSALDLSQRLDDFERFSLTPAMHSRVERPRLAQISDSVVKEIVAFSATAAALVDLCRRVTSSLSIPKFDETRKGSFDEKQHEFVKGLRNSVFHIDFPAIGWQIRHAEGGRTTDFTISSQELLLHGDLNAKAKAYVDSCGAAISVRRLLDEYSGAVNRFYEWLDASIQVNLSVELGDFRRLRNSCSAATERQSYSFMIKMALERQSNPYDHLQRYLTPEQLSHVKSLPDHSREQVDFIIGAVDDRNVCDEELRHLVYKLFAVPSY